MDAFERGSRFVLAGDHVSRKAKGKGCDAGLLREGLNNRQLKQRSEKIFSQIDMDGGGTLGMEELDLAFRRMGCKVSREVLHMMVMEVSNDGDDEVDQEEWEWLVANIYRGKRMHRASVI